MTGFGKLGMRDILEIEALPARDRLMLVLREELAPAEFFEAFRLRLVARREAAGFPPAAEPRLRAGLARVAVVASHNAAVAAYGIGRSEIVSRRDRRDEYNAQVVDLLNLLDAWEARGGKCGRDSRR